MNNKRFLTLYLYGFMHIIDLYGIWISQITEKMRNLIIIYLALLFLGCNSQKKTDKEGFAFINVNVITMEDEQVLSDYAVIVQDGKIKEIKPAGDIDTSDYETVLDGSGKYLMPGLAEMHAHIPHPNGENDRIEETLFLYLSNGITTIRGMLGHPSHLQLKTEVESGEILGPRIFTSGPSLNGNTVKTTEEANRQVKAQKEAGYDFVKLHPGIRLEVFDEIVRTAKEAGIGFAGHVPVDVGIVHSLKSGFASIDHVDGYLEGLVPANSGVEPDQNGFFGINFAHLADTNLLPELIRLTIENEVWIVPTQSLFTRWASPEPAKSYLEQPEMKYMPEAVLKNWEQQKNNMISNPGYSAKQWEQMMEVRKQIIRELNQKTDLLLLGSDAPQVFNVPGFSIHHELEDLLDCGLTPYEALKTGTVSPAVFFDQKGQFGSISPDASADLVLLNGNPLQDIRHLQHPAGVMVRGKWLDREFLDRELTRIENQDSTGKSADETAAPNNH
jgi:imidazolonepropionase-like amidohydrolase